MYVMEQRLTDPPGVCFLCEGTHETTYVNMERPHRNAQCSLWGWKQVCYPCVEEMASLYGLISPEKVAEVEARAVAAEDAVVASNALNNLAESINTAQEYLSKVASVSETPNPKPTNEVSEGRGVGNKIPDDAVPSNEVFDADVAGNKVTDDEGNEISKKQAIEDGIPVNKVGSREFVETEGSPAEAPDPGESTEDVAAPVVSGEVDSGESEGISEIFKVKKEDEEEDA